MYLSPIFPRDRALCVSGGILDEYQNYVGGGRGTEAGKIYFSNLPPPTALNPDACPVGTYDTKMAASNGLSFRS